MLWYDKKVFIFEECFEAVREAHRMKKQLGTIMILLITTFIGFGIIIPMLPELVTPFHLGWMLSIYSLTSFVMSPVWGAWSDRFGRRPVILIGILGFSLSFFIFAINVGDMFMMYVSRVIGGFFSGAVTSCCVAYVADVTTNEQRTKAMGLVGMSIGLGFIFGPAFGGLLSIFGYEVPFFAAAGLALLTFLFAWKFLIESYPEEERAKQAAKRPSRWTAFRGAMKYLYVLGFFVTFTLAGLETTLQYFLKGNIVLPVGMEIPLAVGIMFMVSGIVGAAVQGGIVRRYVKHGDEYNVIKIGLVISAAGFFLLLFSNDLFTATIYLTVYAVGNALIRPCVTSLITQKTTVGTRGGHRSQLLHGQSWPHRRSAARSRSFLR
jgi:DHA1 family multidrug resistance protein-like MFS transporter